MTKLRNLDLIFNLCLVVDKTLELAEKNKVKNKTAHGKDHQNFSDGLIWISDYRNWYEGDLAQLWGKNNDLKLNDPNTNLDSIIPRLLLKNEHYQNNSVKREIHDFLIAYKLRNYGGHNITQQNCLTANFDEIIQVIFNCLFMAIELL
jgi:hypothetical protein